MFNRRPSDSYEYLEVLRERQENILLSRDMRVSDLIALINITVIVLEALDVKLLRELRFFFYKKLSKSLVFFQVTHFVLVHCFWSVSIISRKINEKNLIKSQIRRCNNTSESKFKYCLYYILYCVGVKVVITRLERLNIWNVIVRNLCVCERKIAFLSQRLIVTDRYFVFDSYQKSTFSLLRLNNKINFFLIQKFLFYLVSQRIILVLFIQFSSVYE